MYTVYNITTRMPFFNPSQQFPNWDTTTSPRLSVQDVLHQMSSRKPSFRRAERQLLCQEKMFLKKNNNFPDFLQGFITKRDDLKKNPGTIKFRGGAGNSPEILRHLNFSGHPTISSNVRLKDMFFFSQTSAVQTCVISILQPKNTSSIYSIEISNISHECVYTPLFRTHEIGDSL